MKRLVALALVVIALGGCTDADLEPIPPPESAEADNKLRVRGEFCTTDPDDLRFPVKLLFLIDTSSSMETTDPTFARVDAVIEVIDSLRDTDGTEFGIISFGLGANILTERCESYDPRQNCVPGFTTDPDDALVSAVGTGQAAGTTDYLIALETAVSMVAADMASSEEEDLQNARYVIMFLSDGIPDADSSFGARQVCDDARDWANTGAVPNGQLVESIAELLDAFRELAKRYDVRELTFNGGFIAAPDTSLEVKSCGSNLIRAMSNHGEGVFRDFSSGERINFLFVDFTSYKRVFSLKNFVATNLNARPFSEALYVEGNVSSTDPTLAEGIIDSDGDGLTDELEDLIGSDRGHQDTDLDGFSDLVEYRLRASGFDPLDPTDADCVADVDKIDTDGDGLRDCEERFAGTNPKRYDSDLDGFGDGLELLYGSNPSYADGLLDVDFDGADNGREIRWHSKPDTDDVSFLGEHAYRYDVRELGIDGARLCYTFDVANISLASTRGAFGEPDATTVADAGVAGDAGVAEDGVAPAPGLAGSALEPGDNRIFLEVSEAPFDAPNEPGISRVACVQARFDQKRRLKLPANGILDVPVEAFHDAREFDPDTHCVAP